MIKIMSVLLAFLIYWPVSLVEAQSQNRQSMEEIISLQGEIRLLEALRLIADVGGKTLVLTEGIEDKVMVLQIQQVKAREALENILYSAGYGLKIENSMLIILPFETKVFTLSLPPMEQQVLHLTTNESQNGAEKGLSATGNQQSTKTRVGAKVVLENTSGALSYWKDLEENIRSLLTAEGKVSLNRITGMAIVRDRPFVIQQIEKLIQEFERRLERRILVDVKVLEVALSQEHHLGIDWSVLMNHGQLKNSRLNTYFSPQQAPLMGEMILSAHIPSDTAGVGAQGVSVLLKALEGFGKVEVVSQPRIVMLNNIAANIQVGETKSYIESSTIETTSQGTFVTGATLNEVHGGVTLQIVGNMKGDDIFLNVTPVVSTIDQIRSITLSDGAKIEAPETSMKSMNTSVRLKQGETVVLGGLMTQVQQKNQWSIPVLGKIPILGKLFSYESIARKRTELVILITPKKG